MQCYALLRGLIHNSGFQMLCSRTCIFQLNTVSLVSATLHSIHVFLFLPEPIVFGAFIIGRKVPVGSRKRHSTGLENSHRLLTARFILTPASPFPSE